MSDAFAIFILVIGVVGFFFIFRALRGSDPRLDEDYARTFFDEHGHWPDQTPQEAEAERTAGVYAVAEPDEHGNV